jgi:hypothetical protein
MSDVDANANTNTEAATTTDTTERSIKEIMRDFTLLIHQSLTLQGAIKHKLEKLRDNVFSEMATFESRAMNSVNSERLTTYPITDAVTLFGQFLEESRDKLFVVAKKRDELVQELMDAKDAPPGLLASIDELVEALAMGAVNAERYTTTRHSTNGIGGHTKHEESPTSSASNSDPEVDPLDKLARGVGFK